LGRQSIRGKIGISNVKIRKEGILLFVITILLVMVGLSWCNVQFAGRMPGGNDFLVHWVGAKALLRGQSPYADATALEIQTIAYGRPAVAGEHELRVAYPLYAEFLFIPFALIAKNDLARGLWMTALELSALAFAVMALSSAGGAESKIRHFCFLLFSLTWYLGMRALINGNAIILTGFFFLAALLLLQRSKDWLGGLFLALSTIKPQVVLIPIFGLLAWLVFARKWRAIAAFGVSLLGLVLISALFIPDWILQNWKEVVRYPAYNPPGTPAAALASVWGTWGTVVGWTVSVGVWIILAVMWWRSRKKDRQGAMNALMMTITLSPLAGLQTDTGNEWLLLLPIVWLAMGRSGERVSPPYRFYFVLLTVLIGLWWLFLSTMIPGSQPQQHPLMLFPLPIFLVAIAGWDAWRNRIKTAA
jgi:hypothetical protein